MLPTMLSSRHIILSRLFWSVFQWVTIVISTWEFVDPKIIHYLQMHIWTLLLCFCAKRLACCVHQTLFHFDKIIWIEIVMTSTCIDAIYFMHMMYSTSRSYQYTEYCALKRNKWYILNHLGESGYCLHINPNYQVNWPNCCKFSGQWPRSLWNPLR